jgi:hypothetical protein
LSKSFAALKADGSIKAWGDSRFGGKGAPSNGVYTKIYSTNNGFAALPARPHTLIDPSALRAAKADQVE